MFLDYLKKKWAFILCTSDSGLQCNKHNSYWYGVQYQDRQTALGSLYGPWNWYFPRLRLSNIISTGSYHDPWTACTSWYCPSFQ